MTTPIKILIVDDEQLLRLGFRMIFEAQPDLDVVGEAGDGTEAVRLTGQTRPDVVLMDLRMPRTTGIEATEQIASKYPETRVLVLTTFDLDEYAFAALRAGASGFLLKNAEPAQLLAAIRTVAAGDAVVAPRVTRKLLERFAGQLPAGPEDTGQDPRLSLLTDREREVLVELAGGCPTPRSPSACTCPNRLSRHTSGGSCPSWGCATGRRRSCSPTRPGWSAPTEPGRPT